MAGYRCVFWKRLLPNGPGIRWTSVLLSYPGENLLPWTACLDFSRGPSRFTSNYQYRTDVEQLHSTEDMV